ncbi:E3 ubiquitin-protein ligase SGR9, amyloplastic [Rutidosis leptorrhynchoides]|uniref:E3 ubiquitin-protein ligase SGR9, amyloplastic n=1 Tax=Rutidosis leptorrhynchoides TaxID=125765 RepID=UPI003A999003
MDETTTKTIIIQALSTLTPPQITALSATISTIFRRHNHRISALLSSHTLFSLSLHHLHSLSLHQKSFLIARHLLTLLSHLFHFLHPTTARMPPYTTTILNNRDLDTVLLLLLLCEFHQHEPESLKTFSHANWRANLSRYISTTILTLSGIGFGSSTSETLIKYIELVAKCKKFVEVMGYGYWKEGKEVAASVAAVVALPSVEVKQGGKECVICKEEMKQGRDVCELPCEHLFHWMCILPWVIKTNTCPCCRHSLPTDDVYGEIERQWKVVVMIGGGYN